MNIEFLKRLLLFVSLLFIQALVLGHIHLFGVATPLLYIYFVISFRRGYPRWAVLLWSFFLGLGVDVCLNTPGVAAASMTFLGLIQPYVLELFLQRDSEEDVQPTISGIGIVKFGYYSFLLTMVYCLVFFTIETFNFFDWEKWLLNISGSTVLTFALVLVIGNLKIK